MYYACDVLAGDRVYVRRQQERMHRCMVRRRTVCKRQGEEYQIGKASRKQELFGPREPDQTDLRFGT